jgi:hypothetical protein
MLKSRRGLSDGIFIVKDKKVRELHDNNKQKKEPNLSIEFFLSGCVMG